MWGTLDHPLIGLCLHSNFLWVLHYLLVKFPSAIYQRMVSLGGNSISWAQFLCHKSEYFYKITVGISRWEPNGPTNCSSCKAADTAGAGNSQCWWHWGAHGVAAALLSAPLIPCLGLSSEWNFFNHCPFTFFDNLCCKNPTLTQQLLLSGVYCGWGPVPWICILLFLSFWYLLHRH